MTGGSPMTKRKPAYSFTTLGSFSNEIQEPFIHLAEGSLLLFIDLQIPRHMVAENMVLQVAPSLILTSDLDKNHPFPKDPHSDLMTLMTSPD